MHQHPFFLIEFETEKQFAIFTRINSLLFRKSIYPQTLKMEYSEKINGYKVKMNIHCDSLTASILAKQIDRFVGVSNLKIEPMR